MLWAHRDGTFCLKMSLQVLTVGISLEECARGQQLYEEEKFQAGSFMKDRLGLLNANESK